jgi:hypothetical protein
MPNRWSVRVVSVVLALLAGCFSQNRPPYDPFRLSRAEVGAALRVIALAPLEVPKDLENADVVKGRFLSTIEARLREAGIEVVPPWETGPVVAAALESRGGLYDPRTGALDVPKLRAARDEALGRLRAKFGRVDALLFTDLRVVPATVSADSASWAHTTEWAATSGWKSLVNKHSGVIRALALVVRVSGNQGADLYVDSGGVKLLQKVDLGGNLVPVPQAEALGDDLRNAGAVDLALRDLLAAVREARANPPPATPAEPAAAPVPAAAPPSAPAQPPPSPAPASPPPSPPGPPAAIPTPSI